MLPAPPMNSPARMENVLRVLGDVMGIMTALTTAMRRTARPRHVRLGRTLCARMTAFVYWLRGGAIRSLTVPMDLMKRFVISLFTP